MELKIRNWIICLLLVLTTCTGVQADQTKTAVIAASCVVGILLFLAIGICIYFCYRHCSRKEKKRSLSKHQKGQPVANGTPIFSKQEHGTPRPKAYTQHAVHSKQRPPIRFYTLKADPRESMGFNYHPDFVPIAPPHHYRGPTPVGRPVFFMNFMGGESAPADDGPQIEEIPITGDEKHYHRHRSRESQHRKRDKSRSKSRTRSKERSEHQTQDETHILSHPSNFILVPKDEDISGFARNSTRKSKTLTNEINNNEGIDGIGVSTKENPVMNNVEQDIFSSQTRDKSNDFTTGDGPYSVTQIHSTSIRGSEQYPHATQVKTQTMSFGDEDENEIFNENENDVRLDLDSGENVRHFHFEETPRVDYDASESYIIPDISEPTPRIDYLDGESAQNTARKEDTGFKMEDLDDIIALGTSSQAGHPHSPPFDAHTVAEVSDRVHTPPPDMTIDERDPLERLDNLARVPTPPPPPPPPPTGLKSVHGRPGTPPPGVIKKKKNLDIKDILKETAASSQQEDKSQKSPFGSSSKTASGLPFMEELRRRQRSVDDDGSAPPPTSLSFPADDSESTTQLFDLGARGRRASAVQFAQAPPQIIPDMDYPDSPSSVHQLGYQLSSGEIPPPPPPPPPPL